MDEEAGDRIVKLVWQVAWICVWVLVISFVGLILYGLVMGQ